MVEKRERRMEGKGGGSREGGERREEKSEGKEGGGRRKRRKANQDHCQPTPREEPTHPRSFLPHPAVPPGAAATYGLTSGQNKRTSDCGL